MISDDVRRTPRVDCHVRLGSLAQTFGTTPATIPTFNAYLRPPERPAPRRNDARRLLGLCVTDVEELAALAVAASEAFEVTHVSPALDDLAETATALWQVTLLVATQSPVAHLAGAMGKPVWTLLRHPADCRWGAAGASCPWYPSARLFRQGDDGNWSAVLRDILQTLKQLPPATAPLAA